MADSNLHQWARRPRIYGTWHFVQSEIATRIVTPCGREMERETKTGGKLIFKEVLKISDRYATPVCWNCRKEL